MSSILRAGERDPDGESTATAARSSGARPTRDLQESDVPRLQDDLTDRIVATVADVHGGLMRSMRQEVAALRLDEDDACFAVPVLAYQRQHAPRARAAARHLRPGGGPTGSLASRRSGPRWRVCTGTSTASASTSVPTRSRVPHQAATGALDLDPLSQPAWEARASVYFFEHDREGVAHAIDPVLAESAECQRAGARRPSARARRRARSRDAADRPRDRAQSGSPWLVPHGASHARPCQGR